VSARAPLARGEQGTRADRPRSRRPTRVRLPLRFDALLATTAVVNVGALGSVPERRVVLRLRRRPAGPVSPVAGVPGVDADPAPAAGLAGVWTPMDHGDSLPGGWSMTQPFDRC
jgi:hypothetical protein